MLVTNDAAERGIKITSDYINILTKDSAEKQNVLQTVEYTRRKMSNNRKSTIQDSYHNDFDM